MMTLSPFFNSTPLSVSPRTASISVAPKLRYPAIALLSCLLLACSGGSSDHRDNAAPDRSATDSAGNGSKDDSSTGTGVDVDNDAGTGGNDTSDGEDLPDNPLSDSGFYSRPADYPFTTTLPLQFITTRSGKQLGVRVTLPAERRGVAAQGAFPVILVQTAYNVGLTGAMKAPGGALLGAPDPFMVKRGYAQVSVDALGTGVSQGGWDMLGAAEQEAYGDTVDWVLQQPWSNGKLGAAGASYMAISALFSAEQRPDAVQAIFASVPLGDAMRGTVGTGGLLNGVFMSEWMTLTQKLTTQNVQTAFLNPRYISQITAATQEHVEQIDAYYLPLIENALNGDPEITYDSPFWRTRSPLENIDRVKAPTFIFGALHDIFQRDEPLLFERLRQNNVDSRLFIYNGNHMTNFIQAMIGNEETPPITYLMLQWFDKYLKGMDTGTEKIPPVTQYVKNYPTGRTPVEHRDNSFASTSEWPHPLATPERWYLHGDMTLSKTPPTGNEDTHSLSTPEGAEVFAGKSPGGGFLVFDVTLNDGTECSSSFAQWTLGIATIEKPRSCYYNNRVLESGALNYETPLMEEDYYINGPIQADVWIDSTATEAVLSVRVDSVSRNGRRVQPLTNGMLVASGRAVDESRSRFLHGEMIQPYHYFTEEASMPVVPGEMMKMQVEIFPTSAIIPRGSKLRISISPSNQAQGILNRPRQEQAAGGITTIHNSLMYPSSVVVPIVPTSALN